jgi:hypothetical protein
MPPSRPRDTQAPHACWSCYDRQADSVNR